MSDTDSSAFWEGRPLRFHSPRGDSPVSVDILHLACINFAGGVCVRAGDDSCLEVLALLPSEFIIIPSFCIPTCKMVFPAFHRNMASSKSFGLSFQQFYFGQDRMCIYDKLLLLLLYGNNKNNY